ncbi:mas-related G-protein coupled receptor member B2-like [Cheilinus undulatus]|uniref:mas-related G-protein coupled receptor member B2-like n=1 Tax=Cheilinus undulatus TaxID=241271 RepID=UPI001BD5A807|nr:mas-related G-protein coupled receptor member B2-like [Cheilinus undulatus]
MSFYRYLVVAWPLWYRFKRTIKLSVLVSIGTWTLSFMDLFIRLLTLNSYGSRIIHSTLLLLPFPLLIFFLAGTLKALCTAISVPLTEKRQIVGTLVLVLINYTVLFLPWIIWITGVSYRYVALYNVRDAGLYLSFLQFSPLADLILYVFMRKGAIDKLLARLCFCRMTEEQQGQVTVRNGETTEEVSSV